MRPLAALAAVAVVSGLLGACGGDDDAAGDRDDETTTTAAGDGTPSDEPAVPGLDAIAVDPVDGDALRPLLSWEPVDGAARYSLLVFDDAGDAYWAWEGTATQVHLGGGVDDPLPDEAEGPTAEVADSWFVVAHDAGGAPIAASPESEL